MSTADRKLREAGIKPGQPPPPIQENAITGAIADLYSKRFEKTALFYATMSMDGAIEWNAMTMRPEQLNIILAAITRAQVKIGLILEAPAKPAEPEKPKIVEPS